MKVALIFLSILTSVSFCFTGQEKQQPTVCRGKSLPISFLFGWEFSRVAVPLRFGGTRAGSHIQFASDKPFLQVIKSRDEFSDFWKAYYARAEPHLVPPLMEIDFSKEIVVVSAMGFKPSVGSGTLIDGACEVDGHVEVFVTNLNGPCGVVPAITAAPADAVRLPRTELPIIFREIQLSCAQVE